MSEKTLNTQVGHTGATPNVLDQRKQDEKEIEVLPPSRLPVDHDLDEAAIPPDGGYGWVVISAISCINGFTWGFVASYGVYLSYYVTNDVFEGATDVDYAFVGGLNFAVTFFIAPGVTLFSRKCGIKLPMYSGVLVLVGGLVAASFATKTFHLYLTQGAMAGIGLGLIWVPSMPVTAQWFWKKRSLASGITSAGSGIGGLVMSFVIQALIQRLGVRWSLRISGLIVGTLLGISTILVKDRNKQVLPNQRMFDLKLLRRRDVWLFLLWSFTTMFGYVTLILSLANFATSIGLSAQQASTVTALMNLGTAIGRPLIGIAGDRMGRCEVAALGTFVDGILCFAFWLPIHSYPPLIVFALVIGCILGLYWGCVGPLAAEVVGLKELPSLLSITWVTITLPSLFAEVIVLKLRRPDSSHPYLYPQIFAGISYLVSSVFLFELWRLMRVRKARPCSL